MGEIADYYIEQEIQQSASFGSPRRGKSFHDTHFNPFIDGSQYGKLKHFLMHTLPPAKRLTNKEAQRFIYDNLVRKGKVPYPRIGKLNATELNSILQIIKKSNCELNEEEQIAVNRQMGKVNNLVANEEETKMYNKTVAETNAVPKAEVENLFRVELTDRDEGEFAIVVERGMYREVVAVSYAYPHYRQRGFYAGRKSSVFSREDDTDKMVVNMKDLFYSLTVLLNNLASADLLTEKSYNNAVDGYEQFIYEALEFSEFENLIGKTSGLKDGKKKRIQARGTKGANLRNKE